MATYERNHAPPVPRFVPPPVLEFPDMPEDAPQWVEVAGVEKGKEHFLDVIFACGHQEEVHNIIGGQVAITANGLSIDLAWFNAANAELELPRLSIGKDHILVPVRQSSARTYPGIMNCADKIDHHIAYMRTIAHQHRAWQERLHGPCPFPTVTCEAYHSLKVVAGLMPDPLSFLETAEWGLELSEFVFLEHLGLSHEFPGWPGPSPGIPQYHEQRLSRARAIMLIVGENLFWLVHVRGPWSAYQDVQKEHFDEFGEHIQPALTRIKLTLHVDMVLQMWARRNAGVVRLTRRFMEQVAASQDQDLLTMVGIDHERPERRPPRNRHRDAAQTAMNTLFEQAYPDPRYSGMCFSQREPVNNLYPTRNGIKAIKDKAMTPAAITITTTGMVPHTLASPPFYPTATRIDEIHERSTATVIMDTGTAYASIQFVRRAAQLREIVIETLDVGYDRRIGEDSATQQRGRSGREA